MDKQQIISFIKVQIEQGRISREELINVAESSWQDGTGNGTGPSGALHHKSFSWNVINTLYVIGSVIGLAGISVLVGQHWDQIGFGGRIGATLGVSLLAYVLAILLSKSPQQMISQVMFLVSAVLTPLGAFILLSRLDIPFTQMNQAITALVLFSIFAVAQSIVRNDILIIVLTGFATWAYYSLIHYIFSGSLYGEDILKWSTILLGLVYIGIGFIFSKKGKNDQEGKTVVDFLFNLGVLAVSCAGITLGGAWDFIFILFIVAVFYGSVYVQSQMMLMFAAFFLIVDILKITYRYFVGSIGWPVALIITGFLIVAVGYLTFELNQRYLKKNLRQQD